MSSRNSLKHITSTSIPNTGQDGDEYYNPTTGKLYKNVALNGTTLTFVEIPTANSNGIITASALQVAGNVNIGGTVTGGGIRTTSSATPPASPTVGDIWYNTATDVAYRYTFDGVNSVWIDEFSSVNALSQSVDILSPFLLMGA